MVLNPTPSRSTQTRNVLLIGIVVGAVAALLLSTLVRGQTVTKGDLNQINDRLGAIETKLATPSPKPSSSESPLPGSVTITQINKNVSDYIGKTVEVSGKVQSPHQGVGFILVDTDGTFLWVHTKDKIPTGTATVKGTVEQLKDQLAQWKNETGWPDNDSTLTAKLRDEKAFIEAESVK
ncbi:hypothetical protein EXS54_02075 [Patescibacteria group bacterium]|nr:hypothetical protein [Patescibacteria group bacterium]